MAASIAPEEKLINSHGTLLFARKKLKIPVTK
jgi:hypothetical protein